MEKFYYEIPTLKRKEEAIEYIKEHFDNNSNVNGAAVLHKYIDDYEGWLEKLDREYKIIPSEEDIPRRTFFLIRENDDKIIGMINIRLVLNKHWSKTGGNIGYGIRPLERKKGYSKLNLYMGLKVCDRYGIQKVMLDSDVNNIASWKTMEALGGERIKEFFNDDYNLNMYVYNIDVKKALEKYKDTYEKYVDNDNMIR